MWVCGWGVGEAGWGFLEPVRSFETMVVWTDGREVVQQYVLRYGGDDGG